MPNTALTTAALCWPGLCCPSCRGRLEDHESHLACVSCGKVFPVHNGVPALLDRDRSLFDPDGVPAPAPRAGWKSFARALIPSLSANPVSDRNYDRLIRELLERSPAPRALVVGGARAGRGMSSALADPRVEWVETDVLPGDRAEILCDAQQIPFEDRTFDAVVAQAVLEHVADPVRAVAELRRVLKPGGLLYAETPFLQQVHAGAYDFTRYTHLGHRRLFRQFDEIESGAACGPGMALAWAWRGFLQSWFASPGARAAATAFAHLTAFWLVAFDPILCARPAAFDCASSYYFLGTKSERTLADRELIEGYRGLQRT